MVCFSSGLRDLSGFYIYLCDLRLCWSLVILMGVVYRDAWYAQRGLTRTESKRRYIGTLIDTMHRYASQTPEARELVVELEFVWDQIKFNASSSSSSSPLNTVGVPPLSGHQGSAYGSIGGRLARSEDDDERPDMRGENGLRDRLRVLSPVSQPEEEEYYRRRRARSRSTDSDDDERVIKADNEDEDEDEDEEYEEARDSLYEDQASTNTNSNSNTDTGTERTGTERTGSHSDDRAHHHHRHHRRKQLGSGVSADSSNAASQHRHDSHDAVSPKDSRWRRRVEQALTKMTAEIAAVREQMEARTLAHRRRSSLWAWIKWLLWVALRQIIWDLAMLGALLIWMRMRGDRRVENRLRAGWSELKARLGRLKLLKRFGDVPLLP